MEIPETRYTRAPDGAFIAYPGRRAGPVDVVFIRGFFSDLD